MRVCFLGNFRVPHTSENDYLWTMREKLGFDVVPLQETAVSGEMIERAASKADVFMWVHTHGWNTPGRSMCDVLKNLKKKGITTFAYHLDLYMGLIRWREYSQHDYFKVDHFFTVDKLMADWLNDNTETNGHFIRPGVIERDCRINDSRITRDIVFVGSYRYHPEWPYRKALINWLRKTYGDRFELWGPQGAGPVRGAALNALYAETKIVIGDTLCVGFDYPYYTSDRAYEVLGRGGFLIHPRIKGMAEELQGGQDLVYYTYNDVAELNMLIDYYLTHDSEREAIRQHGHTKVISNYTYTHRLREIFKILNSENADD